MEGVRRGLEVTSSRLLEVSCRRCYYWNYSKIRIQRCRLGLQVFLGLIPSHYCSALLKLVVR